MKKRELEKIKGDVDSIIFKSEETGFAVITLDCDGEPVTVTGEIGDIDEGESLMVMGVFSDHPKYGYQFKASLCERMLPSNVTAMKRYLANGIIKGIGPVLAKAIVDKFGTETFEIFEKYPEKLSEVEGITPKKAKKYSEEFKTKFAVRRLMTYLTSKGVSASIGVRAYKRWGESALEMVERNPYVLCNFGVELPFLKADELAMSMGFSVDNEWRVKAGISEVLRLNANNGHTCLPYDRLKTTAMSFLDISEERFDKMLSDLESEQLVVQYQKLNGRTYYMLYEYALADMYISRRLNIMKQFAYDSRIDYSDVIDIAEEESGITYETLQREAINTALSVGFLVMNGGPGTGKTTTLNAMISLFNQQGLNVKLAAPTGRAAKRIADLTGYEAKTIHRLLEVTSGTDEIPRFTHNEENPLDCDVMIVDEMSMVDTLLFAALLKALPINCKLIMVGDIDQLPSVGAGNVLKDIIESKVVPTVTLTEIFRQAQSSRIVTNAHRIVKGEELELGNCDDFFFFQRLDYESLQSLIVDLCKDRLPNTYGISPIENIQVISPTRQGPAGTVELNKVLQSALNPPSKEKSEIKTFLYTFRAGDKVMQNKNNYDIIWHKEVNGEIETGTGIFNGDIGVIQKINKLLGVITIDFDGRVANYSIPMLDNVELAYAITVHKSQGSEFDYVIFTAFSGYEKLNYRNLFYTGVTRAKNMLILVGSKNVIDRMIANNKRSNRYTCLKEMLTEDNGNLIGMNPDIEE